MFFVVKKIVTFRYIIYVNIEWGILKINKHSRHLSTLICNAVKSDRCNAQRPLEGLSVKELKESPGTQSTSR